MKTKILNRLKQEYAHLGLDENTLSGLADMLATSGLVTEENMEGVIANQKAYLEAIQKHIDSRVQGAVDKAKSNTKKELSEKIADLEKQLAEAKKTASGNDDDDIPEWAKREREEREMREKEWQDKIAALEKAKADAEKERAEAEAVRAAAARKQNIENKAKEKGIPDWLITRGFASLPQDADDEAIDKYLSEFATEIKTNFLPVRRSVVQSGEKTATKADVDTIAAKMLPNRVKKEE